LPNIIKMIWSQLEDVANALSEPTKRPSAKPTDRPTPGEDSLH
jgi:hypothetical protein